MYPRSEESIQDNLSQDISYAVDDILGKDGFELEKLELLSSLLYLFRRQANEIKTQSMTNENQYNNTLSPFNTPYNNTSFFNPSMSYNPFQNFNYPQSSITPISPMTPITPINPMGPFNPYNFNNSQPQLPFQYPSQLQPQSLQQPNLIYPGFPSISGETQQPKKKSKKSSHKKKDKSHKDHSKSKDKKSKSKDKKSKSKDSKSKIETFTLNSGQDFNGIINYLTMKTGGNIHDNGTIEVTTNSVLNQSDVPKNLLQQSGLYATIRGDKNAWVLFDFKNMQVDITDYTIKSASSCNMKNWVLEISNDKDTWTTIDERRNCTDLMNWGVTKSYKTNNSKFSRYCRLRHTGDFCEYRPHSTMQTERVEFYGRLKMPN